MDILEFREKYPDYDHVSDEALNKSLHEKYYAGADYGEFTSRFLFGGEKPVELEEGSLWGTAEEFSKSMHDQFLGVGKSVVGTVDWLIPGEQKFLETAKANISKYREKYRNTHKGALAWSARAVGGALPYMAAAMAGGALLGAAGAKVGLGAKGVQQATVLGRFLTGASIMGDNAYDEAKATGATEGQANWERVVVGSITGAIEAVQIERIMKFSNSGKHSLSGFIRTVRNKAWKQAGKGIKSFTADVLKHSMVEGLEEFAQEGVAMAVPYGFRGVKPTKEDGTTDWWAVGERLGAATLGGFVAGGVLGSVMMGGNTYTPSQVKDVLIGEYKIGPTEAEGYAADYAMKTTPEGVDPAKYMVESLGMTQEQADAKVAEQQAGREAVLKAQPPAAAEVIKPEGLAEREPYKLRQGQAAITRDQRTQLKEAGFTIDEIARLEPREAAYILTGKSEVKKLSRRDMLAIGHAIPNKLGMSEGERRDLMEEMTGKRSMGKMNPRQMRTWTNYLQSREQGYEIQPEDYGTPILVGDNATTMEAVLSKAGVEIEALKERDIPELVKPGKFIGAKKTIKLIWDGIYGKFNNPMFHLAEILSPTHGRVVGDSLLQARSTESGHKLMVNKKVLENFEKSQITRDDLARMSKYNNAAFNWLQAIQGMTGSGLETHNVKIGKRTYSMTMGELMSVYLWSNQKDGKAHMLNDGLTFENTQRGDINTGKLSDTDIISMRAMVENDPKAMGAVNTFLEVGAKIWAPSINKVSNRVEGKDIATIPGWFGLIVHGQKKIAGKGVHYDVNFIENKSILHERVGPTEPLVVTDAFALFDVFENAIAEYVGYTEPTRVIRTLLNHIPTKKALADKGLGDVERQLNKLFNRAQSRQEPGGWLERLVNRLLPNIYKSVLHYNVPVMASQYMSAANYGAFTDIKYMKLIGKGLLPSQVKKTLEVSSVAWDRYYMAHSNVIIDAAHKSDQTLRFFSGGKSSWRNKTGMGLRAMDIRALASGMVIAEAEYADAQEGAVAGRAAGYWADRDTSFEKDSTDAQREITRRAEYLWEMSQPSWNKWARSDMTSNPGSKIFFPFRSFHEKSLTIFHRLNLDYSRSDKSMAAKTEWAARFGYVLSGYMTNYVLKCFLWALLFGQVKDLSEYMVGALLSPTGMMPGGKLASDLVHRIVNMAVSDSPGYRGEPIESIGISLINNTIKNAYGYIDYAAYTLKGDDEKAEKVFWKTLRRTTIDVGTLFGTPAQSIDRAYRGWIEDEEKEFKSGQRGEVRRKH